MARDSVRKRYIRTYGRFLLARLALLQPPTLARTLEELELDATIITAIAQTRYLQGRNPVQKIDLLSLAWNYCCQ
ncbi:hypothetical protein DL96DRAFT_1663966, partial [Flagelloscypha sp. PMI_526]